VCVCIYICAYTSTYVQEYSKFVEDIDPTAFNYAFCAGLCASSGTFEKIEKESVLSHLDPVEKIRNMLKVYFFLDCVLSLFLAHRLVLSVSVCHTLCVCLCVCVSILTCLDISIFFVCLSHTHSLIGQARSGV